MGFEASEKESYIPDYFALDGAPGDYADIVYVNPKTKQEVTVSRSFEFGIFDVTLGDTRGKHRYS